MAKRKNNELDLDFSNDIKQIEKDGIQAHYNNIKKDMCTQFADPDEWIREYVVNAYDAGATYCFITGKEDEETIIIIIEDNGHGMGKQGIIDFNTIYRSAKKQGLVKTVGKHGIGKLSAAAIPGQCGFEMETSTGVECWRMKTGFLLDDTSLDLNRVEPVPPTGTQFKITFQKRYPVNRTLINLKNILIKYVRYLPIEIIIFGKSDPNQKKNIWPYNVKDTWADTTNFLVKTYEVSLGGSFFEIILTLDNRAHELYQNRVLISTDYNLFSYGLNRYYNISYLKIQVDSPNFELPFGRHCLSNEEILPVLSAYLRKTIVPDYFAYLRDLYETDIHGIQIY